MSSEELKMLFDKGNSIELSEKKGGTMSFWKVTGQITVGVILVAGGIYGAGVYHNSQVVTVQPEASKQADVKKLAKQTIAFNEAEERDLQRIQKYCFSPFSWDRDPATCKVWLRHYRELGEYSDRELFKEEFDFNANLAFERHGITPGNAESSVVE